METRTFLSFGNKHHLDSHDAFPIENLQNDWTKKSHQRVFFTCILLLNRNVIKLTNCLILSSDQSCLCGRFDRMIPVQDTKVQGTGAAKREKRILLNLVSAIEIALQTFFVNKMPFLFESIIFEKNHIGVSLVMAKIAVRWGVCAMKLFIIIAHRCIFGRHFLSNFPFARSKLADKLFC